MNLLLHRSVRLSCTVALADDRRWGVEAPMDSGAVLVRLCCLLAVAVAVAAAIGHLFSQLLGGSMEDDPKDTKLPQSKASPSFHRQAIMVHA